MKLKPLQSDAEYIARPVGKGHKPDCPCSFCAKARQKRAITTERLKHKGKHLQYLDALVDKNSETFMEPKKTALAVGLKSPPVLTPNERSLLMDRLRAKGLTEDAIAQKLAVLFNAKKVWRHVIPGYGAGEFRVAPQILERQDEDGKLQLETVQTLNEIRGDYPKEGNQMNVALILRVPEGTLTEEEWRERQRKRGEERAGV